MKFAAIPTWTYADQTPSKYTFITAIKLAGLEGKSIRLCAADQRRLLGGVPFGKCLVTVYEDGRIEVGRSVLPLDWVSTFVSPGVAELAARLGERVWDNACNLPGVVFCDDYSLGLVNRCSYCWVMS